MRQAILDANASAGADLIDFAIPGSGVHTITPIGPLQPIIEAVTIDGYTQPGASSNTQLTSDDAVLLIEINGESASEDTGLWTEGINGEVVSDVTIRGLVINRFPGGNVILHGATHRVEGCFIGTDPTGTVARSSSGPGVIAATIGGPLPSQRNVISGNGGTAVSGASVIQGNFIGIDATGTSALSNGSGVIVRASAVIGGPTAQAGTPPGNVISGNGSSGVLYLSFGNRGVTIQGNLIGTNATATAGIPNEGHGISIREFRFPCEPGRHCPPRLPGYATVGGSDSEDGNVIAFNLGAGIGPRARSISSRPSFPRTASTRTGTWESTEALKA